MPYFQFCLVNTKSIEVLEKFASNFALMLTLGKIYYFED